MADRDSDYVRSGYYHYRRQRRNFACAVFWLTILFIIITFIQWIAVLLVCSLRATLVDISWLGPLLLLVALLLIAIFVFFESVRFLMPLNWLIAIIIVECIVWGMARTVAEATFVQFGFALGISSLAITISILVGTMIAHDLTLDVVILFLIAIIFFIGTVFFILIHIIANVKLAMYIYCVLVLVIVLMFALYHAQTINGGRYAEMRLSDHLLAFLILYHDFIIFFLVVLYLLLAIANDGKEILRPHIRWNCNGGGGSDTAPNEPNES